VTESAAQDREELCRILHDTNTGKICPDDTDPTRYGAMAEAVLDRIGGRLPSPPLPASNGQAWRIFLSVLLTGRPPLV
jgi:hypothetical protein